MRNYSRSSKSDNISLICETEQTKCDHIIVLPSKVNIDDIPRIVERELCNMYTYHSTRRTVLLYQKYQLGYRCLFYLIPLLKLASITTDSITIAYNRMLFESIF